MEKKKTDLKLYLILHVMLMVFSLSSVCSKSASAQAFMSPKWILFYGTMILILGIYAIVWQQIIKRMPLTTAYANKAVAVVWGQIWGLLFFHENVTPGKIIGALIIVAGIVLYAKSDAEEGGGDEGRAEQGAPAHGQEGTV
jgi:drug/metabolite transporter (DMT)-like permease